MLRRWKRIKAYLLVMVLIASLLVFGAPVLGAGPQTADLVIMATTDIHGTIYPWDYYKNAPAEYGLAKVATLAKQIRAQYPNALLLDNGDLIQGTPLDYYYARVEPITGGQVHPIIAVMNYMGYNGAAIGNHEFNYGVPFLEQVIKGAKFPYLLANAYKWGTTEPYFTPYTILEVPLGADKVKVGIIGFAPPGINIWDRSNLEGKIQSADIVETANKYVPEMKAKGAQVIVALTHSGISGTSSYDEKATGLGVENAAKLLAEQVQGIDLVVAGHSHQEIPGKALSDPVVGNTLILQPGYWANNLAVATLTLEKADAGWKVVSRSGKLVPAKGVAADQGVLDVAKEAHDKTVAYVNKSLGQTDTPITTYSARLADTAAMQLINEVQRERVKEALKGTEYEKLPVLSAAAPFKAGRNGPTDFTDIQPGDVSVAGIASLYIYDNTLMAVKITGAQLKAWLEHAAENFNEVTKPDSGTQAVINSKFPAYNFDQIDGVNYVIDITKPVGERIVELTYEGQPVSPSQEFILASNNYRVGGGGNFAGTGKDAIKIYDRLEENRQLIGEYIQQHGRVAPWPDYNWRIKENFLNHWAAKYAMDLVNRGVLRGDSNGRLFLDSPVTRAEFATLLARAMGIQPVKGTLSPFNDTAGHWAEKEIAAMASRGVVAGVGGGLFKPDDPVSRQEAVTMLVRARVNAGELAKQGTGALGAYKDGSSTADWAKAATAFALEHGVLTGSAGELQPAGNLLRGEAAKIIDLSVPELLPPQQTKLTLITLNDFHGHMDQYYKKTPGSDVGSERLTTAFLGEEWANPGGVLLLNAGDTYQGTTISNLVQGQSVNEWLNAAGFDALAVGNHEFDWTVDVLKQRMGDAKFPFLASNIYDGATHQPVNWVQPTTMLNAAGLKVGVVGATTEATASIVMPANVKGLEFPNPTARFDELIPKLKAQGADVVIGLTHLGSDIGADGTLANEARTDLDGMKEHFDALVTGHTHRAVATTYKGTPVVQALSYGKAYGKVNLYYDKNLKKVVRSTVEVVQPSQALYPNADTTALMNKWKEAIGPKVKEVIATTAAPLTRDITPSGESLLGDLIADAQRAAVGADIAIMNGGGIRENIDAGETTWEELYKVQPFGNVLFKVNLTGQQVKQVLEEGVDNYYRSYNKTRPP
ncbi:MAG: bifunctional 2',3'-cyclic-nucleotide 2'-phosphodiesterase/3'-nucleotidase, partial [Firmicutes bacterium]|nr:bifunctional 2',3'-cyclic-nucleotide 2'-phosphodiesterase/3'-nucleotidase [Bacillota bacterium]